jgi:hypothetical protein
VKIAAKKPKVASSPKKTTKKKDPENVKRGKRSRNKGSSYERTIAKKFAEVYGVELVRTPQSGGFVKNSLKAEDFRGDIVPADSTIKLVLHVECKNTQKWTLPQWLKQAESDCPEGKVPVVVFHQHNSSKDYVCLSLSDFMSLVPKKKIILKKV